MAQFAARAGKLAFLCLLGVLLAFAQDWNTAESLPGVDFHGLTPAQKATALKILREHPCSCGCDMKIAECRVKDPNCSFSTGLAGVIVDSIRKGHSEAEALKAAEASPFAHPPAQDTRILSDPVSLQIDGAPFTGPKEAPLTLVEFSDFQCPYCALARVQLAAVLKAYPTQVKLVFKQFPLDIHSQAQFAAIAALAAQKQGKFWQMHDALFSNRENLSRQNILALAGAQGLDMHRFQADVNSPELAKVVSTDLQQGLRAGVMGTPTLFVNGRRYNGRIALDALKPILDEQLKNPEGAKQVAAQAARSR